MDKDIVPGLEHKQKSLVPASNKPQVLTNI